LLIQFIIAHPLVGWYLLASVLVVGATIYGAKYVFRVMHVYYGWQQWEAREWARSHPNMVLAAILLLAKLTVFCGLAWIIIAALVPQHD
jgi:NADH:ubiquinone oxidoreductase subunit 5 (subunit L)/multisubunit Na+/H+ antiporter MnhA subunit